MNLARLCARLKPVFVSKKGPSKARLLTKMSSSEELGTLATPNLSSIRQHDQWKATAPWWWMYFQCIWLQVSRLVPMMALCSISEDKAAQEGNQLEKKSFDRDQNWWEDPLQSGSQPEGGREFNVTFWKVLRSSERFRLSRTESKVAFYIYVSWPLRVIMGQVKSTWPSSFTGNTGSWRGTQPLVSPSIKITWWPDDHQTLHTMIHGVQGQMFRGRGGEIVSEADSNLAPRRQHCGEPAWNSLICFAKTKLENLPEHVMLDEEGVVGGLEDEVLHEGLRDVLVRLLKLTKN